MNSDQLSNKVDINPLRKLRKGQLSRYIAMDDLKPWERSVSHWIEREFKSGSKFQNGDTLLARITPCLENGKTAYVDFLDEGEIAHGSTEFMVLSGKPSVSDNLFVYYLSRSPEFRSFAIQSMEGTSGRQRVPMSAVDKFQFQFPTLEKQREIAQILGAFDDKIELNRRMNETLEAMARALFKCWFVDFEPVRLKAKAIDPSLPPDKGGLGLPPEISALFPDSFTESELGEIPKGWKAGTLADLAVLNPETWMEDTAPDEIEYVDLSNTKWGRIESTTKHQWKEAPSRAQRVLRPGDTIVGTVRPANGSFALIGVEDLTGSTGFAVLRPRRSEFREVVYLAATALDKIERLAHLADGAAYPAVRPDAVAATPVVKSSDAILDGFRKTVRFLLDEVAANDHESRTLASLRDALLPKLISGEKDIFSINVQEVNNE